jgi:uncharacterized membrane protein
MSLQKDLPELVEAGVISQGTADTINNYYLSKGGNSQSRLLVIFGILGAILVGLGIILIIAHNWDELSRFTKLCIAFFTLIICQVLSVFVLIKKPENTAWRESVAVLLFFAVGTAISLVSQVYHISGDLSSFLLTWMVLSFPVIYILRSSVVSLLYIAGVTWYAVVNDYWVYGHTETYYYWLLLLLALPHYYLLYKEKPASNFMVLHNWIVPVSLTITLGTLATNQDELMFVAYISLFGLFYIIGNTGFFKKQRAISNGYRVLGSLGTICILLFLSFNFFWERLQKERIGGISPELMACIIVTTVAITALYFQKKSSAVKDYKPIEFAFLFFVLCFLIGTVSTSGVVFVNILIFAIGVLTIMNGAKAGHLGILNYGLLIITALVVCRFFDTGLSFVARGILFVLVGSGFFFANYYMIKKRKQND